MKTNPEIRSIQRLLSEMGEAACYFLCFCSVAGHWVGRRLNYVQDFIDAWKRGLIYYNQDNPQDPNNCLVQNSKTLMEFMVGFPVVYWKESPEYSPMPDEWVIQRWEWKKPNGQVQVHFKTKHMDPAGESQTVKHGNMTDQRVFKKKAV